VAPARWLQGGVVRWAPDATAAHRRSRAEAAHDGTQARLREAAMTGKGPAMHGAPLSGPVDWGARRGKRSQRIEPAKHVLLDFPEHGSEVVSLREGHVIVVRIR